LVLGWAREAEAAGFGSLGVLDRITNDGWDPVVSLAAAAAVTDQIALVSMVIVGPLRNTRVLAKEVASVDALSQGRLVLGLSVGARKEDYEAVGVDPSTRGEDLSGQISELRRIWEDPQIGPATGTPILIGGGSDSALNRMARLADGYIHGGGPPRSFEAAAGRVRSAWTTAERDGAPRLMAQAYFCLGDVGAGNSYLRDYYAFAGAFAEKVVAQNLTSVNAIGELIRGYAEAGCEDLVMLPTVSDPAEVGRLAEAIG
jgi:alkanesulfonate monooxygenase SsuD/methylene tetrahydromethanopterin reductase-like flavin-dependent oxidoreductase (luciferase family)